MAEMATNAIDQMLGMLAPDAEPPAGLGRLKSAVSGGDGGQISLRMYELLIEQTLDYDVTEERQLVKTSVDYSNVEDPLVKEKMAYIVRET